MPITNDPSMEGESIDQVIADYLQAVEAGRPPDRQQLLARHPELAAALREFFADCDRMDCLAAPLHVGGNLEATQPPEGVSETAPITVSYFGDYELLQEIARGGMGVVFRARQKSLNRMV